MTSACAQNEDAPTSILPRRPGEEAGTERVSLKCATHELTAA